MRKNPWDFNSNTLSTSLAHSFSLTPLLPLVQGLIEREIFDNLEMWRWIPLDLNPNTLKITGTVTCSDSPSSMLQGHSEREICDKFEKWRWNPLDFKPNTLLSSVTLIHTLTLLLPLLHSLMEREIFDNLERWRWIPLDFNPNTLTKLLTFSPSQTPFFHSFRVSVKRKSLVFLKGGDIFP